MELEFARHHSITLRRFWVVSGSLLLVLAFALLVNRAEHGTLQYARYAPQLGLLGVIWILGLRELRKRINRRGVESPEVRPWSWVRVIGVWSTMVLAFGLLTFLWWGL